MLTIFTLNLNYYVDKHGEWGQRKKLIAEVIEENAPDVVAFQAACSDPEFSDGMNQAEQLAGLLPEYSHRHFFTSSRQPDGRQEGNALISKLPVVETESFLLTLTPGTEDPAQRLVAKAVLAGHAGLFTLFVGHFSWVAEQTQSNVREALGFLKRSRNFLLVGDLNTDPKGGLLQPFKAAGLSDVWETLHGDEYGYTFESNEPFTRIDYAWADDRAVKAVNAIDIVKREKDGVRMSDHMGLLVTVDV